MHHAIALYREQRAALALPEFQQAPLTETNDLQSQANLAALFALHRYSEASAAFAHAAQLSPDDSSLQTNLGPALQKAGREEEARKAFAQAQKLSEAQKKAAASGSN